MKIAYAQRVPKRIHKAEFQSKAVQIEEKVTGEPENCENVKLQKNITHCGMKIVIKCTKENRCWKDQ